MLTSVSGGLQDNWLRWFTLSCNVCLDIPSMRFYTFSSGMQTKIKDLSLFYLPQSIKRANFNRSQFPLHFVMLLGPGGCMGRDSHARKVLAPNKMVWLNICLPALYLSGLWKFPWRDTFLSGTAGSACELTLFVRLLCVAPGRFTLKEQQ